MSKYDPYVIGDDESSHEEEEIHSSDDDDDDENIEGSTKELIVSLFATASELGGGNFTCGGELSSDFGLPGLEIVVPSSSTSEDNSGGSSSTNITYKPIGLPIIFKEQASELISHCSKAPYGKGEATVYDDNVRNSWQLSPSQFRITNKNWQTMMDRLVQDKLKPGLGIHDSCMVRYSLYKLLLY